MRENLCLAKVKIFPKNTHKKHFVLYILKKNTWNKIIILLYILAGMNKNSIRITWIFYIIYGCIHMGFGPIGNGIEQYLHSFII